MDILTDKRTISQEGFMLAEAVIMKTGPLPYLRNELGLEGGADEIININRSRSVVESALPSMVGAPVTIDHPPNKRVDSYDAAEKIVGSIVSIPTIDASGKVKAKIRIYNKEAVDRIENGVDELSPGFRFGIKDYNENTNTADIGKMTVNHIAIVPKGRAGSAVRILDSLPPALQNKNIEDHNMIDEKKLNELISTAVDKAMSSKSSNQDVTAIKGQFVDAISEVMKPALDSIAEMKTAQDKAVQDAKEKEAADSAEKAKNELIEQVVADERARYAILADALPFIAEDKRKELETKDAKTILMAAVGDSVADADNKSVDYLRGALDNMVKSAADRMSQAPAGVVNTSGSANVTPTNEAADIYKKRYENRFKQGAK